MRLLEVRDLTIRLGEVSFVRNLNFSVEEGKTLAIIGESGAGKTLTALAIMGFLDRTIFSLQGSVFFLGDDLLTKDETERKRLYLDEIAMVWQVPFARLSPVQKIKTNINTIYKIKKKKLICICCKACLGKCNLI